MDFKKKVFNYIDAGSLLAKGEGCVVGLSGGADSVALLCVLAEYAKQRNIKIYAAHVNHNMRESAMRDQIFATNLCKKMNIEFEVLNADIYAHADKRGISAEEAGREVRYEFFERLADKYSDGNCNVKIAVAHHMCDQAETVLFNMIRGSGIRGIRGITQGDRIIRPLLCVTKDEITDYLNECGISWMEDETNKCVDYSRNKIRNIILPNLVSINSEATAHIAEMAEEAGEIEELIEELVEESMSKYTREDEGVLIVSELKSERSLIARRVVLEVLRRVSGKMRDIGRIQVAAVLDLFESEVGSRRSFIYGIQAIRTYEGVKVYISDGGLQKQTCDIDEVGEIVPGESLAIGGMVFTTSLLTEFDIKNIPVKRYTKWFDCDRIKNRLEVRHRRSRDYLIVDAAGSRKMLNDYFKDEKIELSKRDKIWVVADGSHILWVVGYRIGEYHKVTDKTKQVTEISVSEGE